MKTPSDFVPERPPPVGAPAAAPSPRRRWRRWAVALGFAFLALLGGWVWWDNFKPAFDCRSRRAGAEQALDAESRAVAADPLFRGARPEEAGSFCEPFDYTTTAVIPFPAGDRLDDEAVGAVLERNGWSAEGPWSPQFVEPVSAGDTCFEKTMPNGAVAEASIEPASVSISIFHWREGDCATHDPRPQTGNRGGGALGSMRVPSGR